MTCNRCNEEHDGVKYNFSITTNTDLPMCFNYTLCSGCMSKFVDFLTKPARRRKREQS